MSTKGLEEPYMDEIRRIGVSLGLSLDDIRKDLDRTSVAMYDILDLLLYRSDYAGFTDRDSRMASDKYTKSVFLRAVFESLREHARSSLTESNDGA